MTRFYTITLPMDLLWQEVDADDYMADATEEGFVTDLNDALYKAGYEETQVSWSTVNEVNIEIDEDGEEVHDSFEHDQIRNIISTIDVNYIEPIED